MEEIANTTLTLVDGDRDRLLRELFERLIHEEGDGWKQAAERLAPRRGHLALVKAVDQEFCNGHDT